MDEHTRHRVERILTRRTQRAVALQVGIAPSVLSEYELGYRTLPPEIVQRIRAALRPQHNPPARPTAPSGVERR